MKGYSGYTWIGGLLMCMSCGTHELKRVNPWDVKRDLGHEEDQGKVFDAEIGMEQDVWIEKDAGSLHDLTSEHDMGGVSSDLSACPTQKIVNTSWFGAKALGGCIDHTFFQSFGTHEDSSAFVLGFLNVNACSSQYAELCYGEYTQTCDTLTLKCQLAPSDKSLKINKPSNDVPTFERTGNYKMRSDNTLVFDVHRPTSEGFKRVERVSGSEFSYPNMSQKAFELTSTMVFDPSWLKKDGSFELLLKVSIVEVIRNGMGSSKVFDESFEFKLQATMQTMGSNVRHLYLYHPSAPEPLSAWISVLEDHTMLSSDKAWRVAQLLAGHYVVEDGLLLGEHVYAGSGLPFYWETTPDPCNVLHYRKKLPDFDAYCKAQHAP